MPSIFSTYEQRENRVTSTFTTLLRTLSIDQAQMLLDMLLEESGLELVTIKNQSGQVESTPDAEISGNFKIFIETKVEPKAINWKQLKRHCKALPPDLVEQGRAALILLTPDAKSPIPESCELPIVWLNFDTLVDALEKLDETSFLSEKERFFIQNYKEYLAEEGLLSMAENRVVVVPAGLAWEEYQECNAYICQERRTFQPSKRLAFYTKGEIKPQIPEILAVFDSVFFPEKDEKFEPEKHILLPSDVKSLDDSIRQQLVDAVNCWREKRNEYGRNFKVFLLSPYLENTDEAPNNKHKGTWLLSDSVKHKPKGKMTAYVQNQRNVDFNSLKKAKTTATLEDAKEK